MPMNRLIMIIHNNSVNCKRLYNLKIGQKQCFVSSKILKLHEESGVALPKSQYRLKKNGDANDADCHALPGGNCLVQKQNSQ